jgi:hypothetical protein
MDRTQAKDYGQITIGGRTVRGYLNKDRIIGIPGTLVDAADKNQMQEEIVRTIEDAGFMPNSSEVDQLARSIHRIAVAESAAATVFPIEIELLSSPQIIDLRTFGIVNAGHNYLAVLQVQGENSSDVAVSYRFDETDRLKLIIYSRYTDSSGQRVAGLPYIVAYNSLGSELGTALGGISSGVIVKINIFLREFEEV